ncbi:hypothetical protein [Mycoplasmopsis canis]|uniref:hypothetical protein n=1 Tax=Mycoplasmopsis canis TaxID=29555 RepID=UPI00025ACFEA|nr:hypothetical protein [Mycoplasmopsis canis]EIE40954.1 hypothetical protein MCANUF33_00688 [Mycoplasmopsis canis UF33]
MEHKQIYLKSVIFYMNVWLKKKYFYYIAFSFLFIFLSFLVLINLSQLIFEDDNYLLFQNLIIKIFAGVITLFSLISYLYLILGLKSYKREGYSAYDNEFKKTLWTIQYFKLNKLIDNIPQENIDEKLKDTVYKINWRLYIWFSCLHLVNIVICNILFYWLAFNLFAIFPYWIIIIIYILLSIPFFIFSFVAFRKYKLLLKTLSDNNLPNQKTSS